MDRRATPVMQHARLAVACALTGLLLGACGEGDPDPGGDAGPPDAGDGDAAPDLVIAPPVPPAPAARPLLTPCPAGWRAVVESAVEGLVTCDPWPEGGPEDCAAEEAHFPGTEECTRIGTACPEGDWPEDLPVDREVVYVRPDAPPGGDGSEAEPFQTIARAVTWVDDGGVVALSKGTFEENVWLEREVTLWGACVAETVVTWPVAGDLSTVVVQGTGAEVKNLTVTGAAGGFNVDGTGGDELVLDSVVVRDSDWVGVEAYGGATLTATNLVLRDVALAGVLASDGASVHLARVAIERVQGSGIRAFDEGTTVVAEDVAVREPRAGGQNTFPHGIESLDGAHVDVARAALVSNFNAALYAATGGTLVAMDVAVRDTEAVDPTSPLQDDQTGAGAYAVSHGRVELSRATLTGGRLVGATAVLDGVLAATDVVVADTRPRTIDGDLGLGVYTAERGDATLLRVAIVRSTEAGLLLNFAGTATVTDLLVRDTSLPATDHGNADGISLLGESRLVLERAEVAGSARVGILLGEVGTVLEATDLSVRDPPDETEPGNGAGISVQGASASLTRVAIEGVRVAGLRAFGNTAAVDATDLTIRVISSSQPDGQDGEGVLAAHGAAVHLVRARVEHGRMVGLFSADPGSTLTCEEVVVADTSPAECAESTCADAGGGIGFLAALGSLEATRFEVSGAALAGVMLTSGSQMDLHDGIVRDNPIGANVQDETFDISRLQDRVRYLDNGRQLDASALPVPDVGWRL